MLNLNKNFKKTYAHGLTLVEVVVSIAILAILSLAVVTVMAQSITFLMITHKRTAGGMAAAASINSQRAAANAVTDNGEATFKATDGTSSFTVSGQYNSGKSDDGTTYYYEFVPDSSK